MAQIRVKADPDSFSCARSVTLLWQREKFKKFSNAISPSHNNTSDAFTHSSNWVAIAVLSPAPRQVSKMRWRDFPAKPTAGSAFNPRIPHTCSGLAVQKDRDWKSLHSTAPLSSETECCLSVVMRRLWQSDLFKWQHSVRTTVPNNYICHRITHNISFIEQKQNGTFWKAYKSN